MQASIKLTDINQKYFEYRVNRPEIVSSIQISMERVGQLQPVLVCRDKDVYELIDGFKRYHAALELRWDCLLAQVVEIDEVTAKTMIMRYNQQGSPLMEYEEARIVYSLKRDHGMKQEEISQALSRSLSWVSRRLGFIEKLGESVQHQLRLGIISASQARELAKLPRGKQDDFLKLITQHCLTSRHTAVLVSEYHKARTVGQQEYLMKNPLEVLAHASQESQLYDCRLGAHGNRLLKSVSVLSNQQHIFIGYSTHPPLKELTGIETDILSERFTDVLKKTRIIQSILKAYGQHEE
jgi:ParB family transcriptional regulator, chromosome partitioning protein